MNYADMALGTWFPQGGMFEVVKAMEQLAKEKGVKFVYDAPVEAFEFEGKSIKAVKSRNQRFEADVIVSSADYHFTETKLLPKQFRNYKDAYWAKRTMAPSSLIYYIGIKGELKNLAHHNLFFDESLDAHAEEIYTNPQWPTKPLFYVSVTTKTDATGAPEGCENLFILIPVAAGLEDNQEVRDRYYAMVMDRLELHTGQDVRSRVEYLRSYAYSDFVSDYNSYRGNAYGLANTLMQTANLKPTCKNKKLTNLYYAGQLTVPGPGVPPALISGKVIAEEIHKDFF
jgi:phytoene desaturase